MGARSWLSVGSLVFLLLGGCDPAPGDSAAAGPSESPAAEADIGNPSGQITTVLFRAGQQIRQVGKTWFISPEQLEHPPRFGQEGATGFAESDNFIVSIEQADAVQIFDNRFDYLDVAGMVLEVLAKVDPLVFVEFVEKSVVE